MQADKPWMPPEIDVAGRSPASLPLIRVTMLPGQKMCRRPTRLARWSWASRRWSAASHHMNAGKNPL